MSRWSVLLGATAAIAFASISTSGCKNGGGADNLGFFIPPSNLSAITSVIPNSGSILGGNSITVIGSNFGEGASLRVGQTDLTNIAQPNTFTISGTIPAGTYTAGPVDVSVLTSSQTAILQGGYTFEDMTFTSITPNNGPITGDVPVVIRGANFKNVPLSAVVLSGAGGTIQAVLQNVIVSANFDTINAIVPPGLPLGVYNLIITSTSHGQKDFGAVYTVGTGASTTMLITDIRSQPGNQSPAHGPLAGGTTVTLTADLTAPAPAGFVGGINVTLLYPNGSVISASNISVATNFGTLTFTTPAAPGGFFGGPVTIRVDSATQGFATAANGFNYDPANTTPAINSVSPAIGPQGGGTLVTVLGINFRSGNVSNVRRVLIGGVPGLGLAVQSTSQLQFTTPPGVAGLQPVIVESTTGLTSNAVNFQYQPSIVISKLNPNNGPLAGGYSVTITGFNFTTATIVSGSIAIAGKPIDNLRVTSPTTLTGIIPAGGSDGPADVVVAANGGLPGMTLRQGFSYGPAFDPPVDQFGVDNAFQIPGTAAGQSRAFALGSFSGGSTDVVIVNGAPANSMVIVTAVTDLFDGSSNSGALTFPQLNDPIDVAVADMNGDGLQDIVVLNNNAGGAGNQSVAIFTNNGAGGFVFLSQSNASTLPSFGAALQAVALDVADVNSDGRADVAVLGSSTVAATTNGVGIFTNNPASPGSLLVGTFAALSATDLGASDLKIVGTGGTATKPAPDLNSDGFADIIVTCRESGTVVGLVGNGNGVFTLSASTSAGAAGVRPNSLAASDVDENGTVDVVTANANGTISVLVGNGAGALALFANFSGPATGTNDFRSVVIGDVNFDCREDVVVASFNGSNVTTFNGNGDGSFSDPVNYAGIRNWVNPGPGGTDLRPTAHIVAIAPLFTANGLDGVLCLDDQRPAAPALTGTNGCFLSQTFRHSIDAYLGDFIATPLFTSSSQGIQPQAVAYGDLNGDARLDFVLVNRSTGNLQVFIGDGFGNFTQPFAPVPLKAGANPEGVLIARIDNTSGNPGILVACAGVSQVAFLRNFGGGSLGNPVYFTLMGTGPHQVLAEDMNADGKFDIITVNQASNSVEILLGDGTGNFVSAVGSPYTVGNGPLSAAIADLNADGLLDVAVANFASDDVTVLRMTARTATGVTFSGRTIPLSGPITTDPLTQSGGGPVTVNRGRVEPRSIAIGDLNADGAPDIVTADSFTGTITILYGKLGGLLTLAAAPLSNFVANDTVFGPAVGVVPGGTPLATSASSYSARVVAVVAPNVFTVDSIRGGGRLLGGEANFGAAASPNVPTAFRVGDALTNPARVGGNVLTLTNVRPTGDFFQIIRQGSTASDYLADGSLTRVGDPSVVLKVGGTPVQVKIFDMNSDGFPDIVVGDFSGNVVSMIGQSSANELAFQTNGLIQTARNTPSFAIDQTDPMGVVIGGPLRVVSPSGEFTIKAADTSLYGLPVAPANPHSGYPIRITGTPPVAPGADAMFKATIGGSLLGFDIGNVTLDCPPSVVVVSTDNTVRVIKTK